MKKYEITTTVNGKVLVKQLHISGTDGCKTSYGDFWGFETCADALSWVDRELGNTALTLAQQAMRQNESQPYSSYLTNPLFTVDKNGDVAPIKKYVGIEIDNAQVKPAIISDETLKTLSDSIDEAVEAIKTIGDINE